jgi:hypothetical protein
MTNTKNQSPERGALQCTSFHRQSWTHECRWRVAHQCCAARVGANGADGGVGGQDAMWRWKAS